MTKTRIDVLTERFTPMFQGFGQGNMPAALAREFAKQTIEALDASGTDPDPTSVLQRARSALQFARVVIGHPDDQVANSVIGGAIAAIDGIIVIG